MEPFATVEQYQARYGTGDDEAVLLEALMDATRELTAELDRAGKVFDPEDAVFADRLMQACRTMVRRAMGQGASSVPIGANQYSQGAAGFTESYSLANPYGEIYVSKAERRLLGLGGGRIGFAMPAVRASDA